MINLYKGDCLELMKGLPGGSVDAIITDPPYGTTACKWDSVIDFTLMWEQLNRILKPNGAIVLFGSEPFSSALRMSNIKDYKYDWIWEKNRATGHLNAKKQPMRNTENIIVFYKKQPTYNFQKESGTPYKKTPSTNTYQGYGKHNPVYQNNAGFRYPKTVIKIEVTQNEKHPTQKPVELMEYLIKTYTNENETVLDFTMGSGSTGVDCVNTNRKFIGIEKDENYFNIASKRIDEGQTIKDLLGC